MLNTIQQDAMLRPIYALLSEAAHRQPINDSRVTKHPLDATLVTRVALVLESAIAADDEEPVH